ncbi:phage terminase large subunit family protein [Methylophilus sp. VKM B-3414]|uniref:phage terminase large subunit family protein n=1 Tax=Methylophilus sp. VKM B-3414 TaxID=3076121 RepID=UPI0028C8C30E|nr:phage terminase large subunit family protein [Methylophilus sp. VKM B-3414]MDT7849926.1 phage terminase large subunit family protein [Methylophilus sp. VKM B-3414]
MGAPDTQLVDAYRLIDSLFAEHFRPRIPKDVDEWADANRILPAGSAEAGPWRTDRTPFAREIYKALSDSDPCEEVVLMTATQLVKSEAGLNWIGTIIEETPAPVMIVQATGNTGKRYSRQRVGPMIANCPSLRKRVASAVARDAANSASMKEFTGGVLIITGANSAAELASMPAKYIHFDEVDDYPDDCGGQGDPISIAVARQDTFRRRKRLLSSSPKKPKGYSIIENAYLAGTQEQYHVPCPHCGHKQVLVWANLKWLKNEAGEALPETARYLCDGCSVLIDEHHKEKMLAVGEWVAKYPERKGLRRSFHLSSLYSPLGWLTWADMARQFVLAIELQKKGNNEKYITFVNTRLAETVKEEAEQNSATELLQRAEDYDPAIVPMGGLLICCAVDMQDDRFECFPWAAGEGDLRIALKPEVIRCDPGEESSWQMLDAYLQTRFKHASGQSLPIEAVAIDTGGHYTHMVYNYVRRADPRRKISAIKGDNHKPGIPILGKASNVDVNWRGEIIKGGCKLWFVGVNTAKDLLNNRLKRPGVIRLSKQLPVEYFEGLTAEKRVPQRTARGIRYMWVKVASNARNEPLDGAVYAEWCFERLGVSKYPSKVWEQIRERVQPRIGSLFDQPDQESVSQPQPVQQPAVKQAKRVNNAIPRSSLIGRLRGGR